MKREESAVNQKEVRTFQATEIRVARKKGEKPKIIGHAAVFNSPTVIHGFFGNFTEEIAPGAFEESIGEDDIRGLFNHDPNFVLGRNKAGTLELEEDKTGLRYEIDPPETTIGNDTLISIERGDITGSSFGFNVIEEKWEFSEDENEPDKRTLIKVKLWDVSPVTFPAFDDTDVAVRKHKELRSAFDAKRAEHREDLPPDEPETDSAAEKRQQVEKDPPENPFRSKTSNLDKMKMRQRLSS